MTHQQVFLFKGAGGIEHGLGRGGGKLRKGGFNQAGLGAMCESLFGVGVVENIFPALIGVIGHFGVECFHGIRLDGLGAQQCVELA